MKARLVSAGPPGGRKIREKLQAYFEMLKSLQTGLLLLTGVAGFSSAVCPVINPAQTAALTMSLLMAICGSTVLNMVLDRDIDGRMSRTRRRPLPAGRVSLREAVVVGALLTLIGMIWAWRLSPLYGAIVMAGWFFDVVVYTTLLKRRTAWSIIWGGLAGGMPALAGRALAVGAIDWVGIAMASAVLLWIPTHIMTFSMRYHQDYHLAGIPTFPSQYGEAQTRKVIACFTVFTTIAMVASGIGLGMAWGYLRVLGLLGLGLFVLALASVLRPSPKLNFRLFKFASVYMLGSMLLVVIEAI